MMKSATAPAAPATYSLAASLALSCRLSPEQEAVLEASFQRAKNVDPVEMELIAAEMGVPEGDVQVPPFSAVVRHGAVWLCRVNAFWRGEGDSGPAVNKPGRGIAGAVGAQRARRRIPEAGRVSRSRHARTITLRRRRSRRAGAIGKRRQRPRRPAGGTTTRVLVVLALVLVASACRILPGGPARHPFWLDVGAAFASAGCRLRWRLRDWTARSVYVNKLASPCLAMRMSCRVHPCLARVRAAYLRGALAERDARSSAGAGTADTTDTDFISLLSFLLQMWFTARLSQWRKEQGLGANLSGVV